MGLYSSSSPPPGRDGSSSSSRPGASRLGADGSLLDEEVPCCSVAAEPEPVPSDPSTGWEHVAPRPYNGWEVIAEALPEDEAVRSGGRRIKAVGSPTQPPGPLGVYHRPDAYMAHPSVSIHPDKLRQHTNMKHSRLQCLRQGYRTRRHTSKPKPGCVHVRSKYKH